MRFEDRDITRTAAEQLPALGMAHVPEGRGVITELTVEENLRLGGLGRGEQVETAELDRVYDLFPVLGERRSALAHTLSGGERQMLVVGRALMARPTLLLLDEPSLGLAQRVVAQIFTLLRTSWPRGPDRPPGRAERPERPVLADHGVVLNLGRVVADDGPTCSPATTSCATPTSDSERRPPCNSSSTPRSVA